MEQANAIVVSIADPELVKLRMERLLPIHTQSYSKARRPRTPPRRQPAWRTCGFVVLTILAEGFCWNLLEIRLGTRKVFTDMDVFGLQSCTSRPTSYIDAHSPVHSERKGNIRFGPSLTSSTISTAVHAFDKWQVAMLDMCLDFSSKYEWHHSPPSLQSMFAKFTLIPLVCTMSCDTQIDRDEHQCTGDSAVEPLTWRRSHPSNGEINYAFREVMGRNRRMESRVDRKLIIRLSILVVGTTWLERCKIGVAVVLNS